MKGSISRVGPDRWRLVYDLPPGGDGRRRQRKRVITGTKAARSASFAAPSSRSSAASTSRIGR
jgi:hypothetical protein